MPSIPQSTTNPSQLDLFEISQTLSLGQPQSCNGGHCIIQLFPLASHHIPLDPITRNVSPIMHIYIYTSIYLCILLYLYFIIRISHRHMHTYILIDINTYIYIHIYIYMVISYISHWIPYTPSSSRCIPSHCQGTAEILGSGILWRSDQESMNGWKRNTIYKFWE